MQQLARKLALADSSTRTCSYCLCRGRKADIAKEFVVRRFMGSPRFLVGINLFAVDFHSQLTHLHRHLGSDSLFKKRSFEPGTCPAKIASKNATTNFNIHRFTRLP
jgi:alkylhydroperoxidase family enzyme